MTVYTPGGPCLTRLQHEQQMFQKQLQEKSNSSPIRALQNLATGRTSTDILRRDAVSPLGTAEKTAQPNSSTHGQLLNITI